MTWYEESVAEVNLNVPQFVGNIYYVDATQADDTGVGTSPGTAKKTIQAAIDAGTAGDAVAIKAGTYAENVDLDETGMELWFEIGAILAPSSGTPLTVSANYCKVQCPGGSLRINPGANETGVEITGNWCYIHDVRVPCGSSADIGFDVTGDGCVLTNCRCAAPLVAAFKIQGDKIKMDDCCTGGESGDSSIGFWITNSCDKSRLKNCGSQGHETAGYQVDTGCTNGVVENCYSGGGDGKWTDADDAFVWSHFSYDNILYATSTFTATGGVGGTGTNYNLFKVTGTVRVFHIVGHVITVLPNTSSVPNLELYSTNASVDITDVASGPDIDSAAVGAILKRLNPATEPLIFANPDNTPAIVESSDYRDPHVPVVLCKDDAADTYIQLQLSAALASGAIHWHIEWEPVTDDGFLEPV